MNTWVVEHALARPAPRSVGKSTLNDYNMGHPKAKKRAERVVWRDEAPPGFLVVGAGTVPHPRQAAFQTIPGRSVAALAWECLPARPQKRWLDVEPRNGPHRATDGVGFLAATYLRTGSPVYGSNFHSSTGRG